MVVMYNTSMENTYEVVTSRIDEKDDSEITVVVTLRRNDGVTGDVWVGAGIPEHRRGEVNTLTHGGTWGSSRGYEDTWAIGDSLDCWCPDEFATDYEAAFAIAGSHALSLWEA